MINSQTCIYRYISFANVNELVMIICFSRPVMFPLCPRSVFPVECPPNHHPADFTRPGTNLIELCVPQ